jgi:hypothetical protein
MLRAALLLAIAAALGCGGRSTLELTMPPACTSEDAGGAGDGASVEDTGSGPSDAADGPPSEVDAAQKSCAEVLLCALEAGADPAQLLVCGQGSGSGAILQAGSIVLCASRSCSEFLSSDAGGGLDVGLLMCLVQNCKTELCSCEGLAERIPFGLLSCP